MGSDEQNKQEIRSDAWGSLTDLRIRVGVEVGQGGGSTGVYGRPLLRCQQ